jgi:RNA polymerase sigma-70 factor (ECF subfamily)
MNDTPWSLTGSTLHTLLRDPAAPPAWEAFVERYAPRIYGWCRRWGLQESDAEDVTQTVLLKLVRRLRTFRYDPGKGSFRAWLMTVTRSAWTDFLAERRRPGAAGTGDSSVLELLQTVDAGDDLARSLEDEYERELFEEAKARVQLRVEARDWKVFSALALEGRSGKEVAAELGMTVTATRQVKYRVQQKLTQEVGRLEGANLDPREGE